MTRSISQLHDAFEAAVAGQQVACSKGCAHCCHDYVPIAAEEAFRIAAALRRRAPAAVEAVRRRLVATDARTRGMTPEQRRATRLPCAFLEDGACGIYDERPLTCRTMASLDERACRRFF